MLNVATVCMVFWLVEFYHEGCLPGISKLNHYLGGSKAFFFLLPFYYFGLVFCLKLWLDKTFSLYYWLFFTALKNLLGKVYT